MYCVSVLVPVFRVEKYIARCARSIFEQTYQNLDIVFVDDNSPDRSIFIIKKVLSDYPDRVQQVRIIKHNNNRGLSAARNTAVNNCIGEFLIHVDSDDYLAQNAVELLVDAQKRSDADIVMGSAILLKTLKQNVISSINYENQIEMTRDMCRLTLSHTVWAKLIRKFLYVKHNIHAKEGVNVGEDLQVVPKLSYFASKVVSIDNIVYYYDCTNENSYTNVDSKDNFNKAETKLLQDLESAKIIRDFFENKNPIFKEQTNNNLLVLYGDLLLLYIRHRKKNDFLNTSTYLRGGRIKILNSKIFYLFKLFGYRYLPCRIILILTDYLTKLH